jgi:hypothetical protein
MLRQSSTTGHKIFFPKDSICFLDPATSLYWKNGFISTLSLFFKNTQFWYTSRRSRLAASNSQ